MLSSTAVCIASIFHNKQSQHFASEQALSDPTNAAWILCITCTDSPAHISLSSLEWSEVCKLWAVQLSYRAAYRQGLHSTIPFMIPYNTWLMIRSRMKISIAIYCCISFLAQPYDCTHIHNRAPQIGELSRALLPTFVSSTWTLLCTTVQFGVSRTTRMGHTLYG